MSSYRQCNASSTAVSVSVCCNQFLDELGRAVLASWPHVQIVPVHPVACAH